MKRTYLAVLSVLALASLALAAPASADPTGSSQDGPQLQVYVGSLSAGEFDELRRLGVDEADVTVTDKAGGRIQVEVVMNGLQAAKLRTKGVDLEVKRIDGQSATKRLQTQADDGYEVFRPYTGENGLRQEMVAVARDNPRLVKLVDLGETHQGRKLTALKVSKNARQRPDGQRPAVLYNAAQHAREWITPEMVRRLLHHYLDNYGSDPQITKIIDTTELWFVLVANPDGYDYTFSDERLWRKSLRDNNGDGEITSVDGVDLNRNFPTKWGYDNEGSSNEPFSQTYRGPEPLSEPVDAALNALMQRVGFEFMINYHSAAELLLYGTGWQVSTPTPDDVVYRALAGTDQDAGVPGYDPDVSAELYTTNGETTEHVHNAYGTLAFTPEMSTCQTASASNPDDEWEPQECESIFTFPDDEQLVQAEFEKNIPFALAVAKSAQDPDDPVAPSTLDDPVGSPPFQIDPFQVSYGDPQPVAVTAQRAVRNLRMHYSINDGRAQRVKVREWDGGERYGSAKDHYYAEFRGTVSGAQPGDSVEVWFTGVEPGHGPVESKHFTYDVADVGGDVLILAAEDVTGISPDQEGSTARHVDSYAAALEEAGYSHDVYDVDARDRTAPHHLGTLSHYDAVVWETGDDIIPREEGQPAGTAAELALDLQLTVRDYLNEGGKLLWTGKYAGFATGQDGSYYYNPFEEEQGECTAREYPCLPLLNDFEQYYLGAYTYVTDGGTGEDGQPFPLAGDSGAFDGFEGTLNGGTSADNQDHTASFLTTSSFLPPDEFPRFASSDPLEWVRPGGAPFDPHSGERYAYSQRASISYKRLTRTIDLTGASDATLQFWTSYDIERNWDFMFVEAHPVGSDDWTTLPDANGHTTQETGQSCASGWVDQLHPHLAHYQADNCEPTGSTGEWHAATANSGGWQQWSVDLSRYAGQRVEVSIAYVSDWATQGLGVFVDDTQVVVDGAPASETSFESDLGGWTVSGPAEGSDPNSNDWVRTQTAFEEGAGVATEDTVYVGFGAEGLTTAEQRTAFISRAMGHLLGGAAG